ncbi:TIGR03862 family flavoprotein [Acetobacteraceae bacterium KSS8]|uniref:TIGR03862 family flavoprotein n=2 Tax=Endosaccharibacter trunci TaxID=2812733 RepID=A0ABT1W8C9_9PROT|nr:TIGR03862 family flavoprotein [Acetobacteraceae bacterium KSS8]
MAAERIAPHARVIVLEQMPSPARKLLMAGRGGLNLSHSEPIEPFLERYGAARSWLEPVIRAFPPDALIEWAADLGQPCFVGSSGRWFPRAMKASPLLRAWLRRLEDQGVQLRTRTRFLGFAEGGVRIADGSGESVLRAEAVVLAMGGASWPRLGSDGTWAPVLAEADVPVAPFQPANCGFSCGWSAVFADRFAGEPLKNVRLSFGALSSRGDAILSRNGIEGGAVYGLSAPLRDAVASGVPASLRLDLRPDQTEADLAARLARVRGRESLSNMLRKALSLSPAAIGLLRECGEPPERAPATLAARIKSVPVPILAACGLDRAISSAGGIEAGAIDATMMLRARPGVFACGEMLDWEAPTGGYLLQASFATGHAAGLGALRWLRSRSA